MDLGRRFTELAEHQNFSAYLVARLDRDAIPALITTLLRPMDNRADVVWC
jgi:hypothetical protein